jgi:hypothetical protein
MDSGIEKVITGAKSLTKKRGPKPYTREPELLALLQNLDNWILSGQPESSNGAFEFPLTAERMHNKVANFRAGGKLKSKFSIKTVGENRCQVGPREVMGYITQTGLLRMLKAGRNVLLKTTKTERQISNVLRWWRISHHIGAFKVKTLVEGQVLLVYLASAPEFHTITIKEEKA